MSDNPLDSIPTFDRVSLRAVLVHDGEDPTDALAQAGLIDAVVVPVVMGDVDRLSGGILGDGVTPNVTAVLETEQTDQPEQAQKGPAKAANPVAGRQPLSTRGQRSGDDPGSAGAAGTLLPAAYGMRSFAPVRKTGG